MGNGTVRTIIEAAIAALLCAGIAVLLERGRRLLRRAVPKTDGAALFSVIAVSGDAPQLQQTVKALVGDGCAKPCAVIIADFGLTDEARLAAEILERENEPVLLAAPEEIPRIFGDAVWTETKIQPENPDNWRGPSPQ